MPLIVVVKCPECGSTKAWKRGTVPTRKGLKVRYICVVDGRTFYGPDRPNLVKPRKGRTKKGNK